MGHFSVKIIAPDGSNLNGNQHALAINEKFYGKKSLELLLILESLAIAYFYDRKFSEAINHIERALKISIEFNGKNDFRSRHLKSTYKMIYDEDDKDLSKYDNFNSNRKTLN